MNASEIRRELFQNREIPYRDFQAKLLPTPEAQTLIGVRTPILRRLAKTLYREQDFAFFFE